MIPTVQNLLLEVGSPLSPHSLILSAVSRQSVSDRQQISLMMYLSYVPQLKENSACSRKALNHDAVCITDPLFAAEMELKEAEKKRNKTRSSRRGL